MTERRIIERGSSNFLELFLITFSQLILIAFIASVMIFFVSFEVSAYDINSLTQKITDYSVTLEVPQHQSISGSNSGSNSDSVHIIQTFYVMSLSDKPIVPGYAKLVLFEGIDPKNIVVDIGGSIKQIDSYELIEKKPTIYYDIWQPIAPGEKIKVTVSFDIDGAITRGVLFKSFSFSLGDLSIPSDSQTFYLKIPRSEYVSYSSPKFESRKIEGKSKIYSYSVSSGDSISVEFSSLPLPSMPFHGYWIWTGFAIIFFLFFVVEAFKLKKYSKKKTE